MAAKINIKNIDYFKFKKIVIDGNRDDYANCSKEVKAMCDSVQTLTFRDEEFDVQSDRSRFEEVCTYYHQILQSKRIDPIDMRIKSGWWGDHKTGYSAGKIKPAVLLEVLVAKTRDWAARHGGIQTSVLEKVEEKIEGPGLYVFKHKEHQCFQYIGRAENVFARCGETLKAAFEGSITDPLAALLVISMSTDWDFYFIPVSASDSNRILRILENDLILKHDCIWPHGLNFSLHIDSLLEVSEFRKSCLRHHWPPETDAIDEKEIDLNRLRKQVASYAACSPDKPFAAPADQNHKSDTSSTHDDADSTGSRKQSRPSTANKTTTSSSNRQQAPSVSTAPKASPSPSKQPTEKEKVSSSTKTNTKSPVKQTTAKQTHQNTESKESVEQVTETSVPSEAESGSPQGDDQAETTTVPTLNRSNTFTYSDSESSEGSADQTKDKQSSAKPQKTPTKQSAPGATKQTSRLPTTSSQRH